MSEQATTDELLELAGAMEQRRALTIVEEVTKLAAKVNESPFRHGYETACEEITHRLRTEVWDGCLPPVDAPKEAATPEVKGSSAPSAEPAEREKYEAWLWTQTWARDHHFHRRDMKGSARLGEYVQMDIEYGWHVWQAARAAATQGAPTPAQPDDWPWPVGVVALGEVTRCLRENGRFVDDEGEITGALEELLQRFDDRAAGIQPTPVQGEASCWLVEKRKDGRTVGFLGHACGSFEWMPTADKATRYVRREDANGVAECCETVDVIVAEHIWG